MHNSRSLELSAKELENLSVRIVREVKKISSNNFCNLDTAIKLIIRAYSNSQNVSEQPILNYLAIPNKYKNFKLPHSFNYNSVGYLIDYLFQKKLLQESSENNNLYNLRKKLGAFFTPYPIAEFITKKTLNSYKKIKILDPACGTGVFLSAAAQIMYSKNISPRDIYNSLYGWDKSKEALYIAKAILCIELGLSSDEQLKFLNNSNFIEKDTLIEPIEQADLFRVENKKLAETYDFIIANPPYDRLKADKATHKYKNEVSEYINKIKTSGLYPLSSTGVLDLYKLFIERIKQLSEGGSTKVGVIVPASFASDKSAYKLRNEMLVKNAISEVLFLPEKVKAFFGVSQAFAIIFMDFNRQKHDILTKTLISSKNLNIGISNVISNQKIMCAFERESNIVDMSSDGYDLLEHLNTFKIIKDVDNIINKRGELDLSLFKDFINSGEPKLLRGKHIREYGVSCNIDTVQFDAFINKIKGTPKYDHIHNKRIVCQQISNMDSKKRLKFAIIQEKMILGNSLNYILTSEDENYLYGLLGVMNSILFDWRFRITSSNNHINNYEIDSLPIPNDHTGLCKLGNKLKSNMSNITSPTFRREIELDVLKLFDCTKFINFLTDSHPTGGILAEKIKKQHNNRMDEYELQAIQS